MNKPKHVFIAGGTGFIGTYAAKAFIEKGILVSAIALPGEMEDLSVVPSEIHLDFGNLFEMSDDALVELFENKGIDTLVYALGPDDRVVPKGNSETFFNQFLVVFPKRLLEAAKKAKISRAIILNSYFSYFDRLYNGKLSKRHPYILARRKQETELLELASEMTFDILFLELPYIFGVLPGRKPLWKEFFLDHFDKMRYVFFPWGGGTSAVDVQNVGRAIVAASYYGNSGDLIPIGDEFILFKDMLKIMLKSKGSNKKIILVPPLLAAIFAHRIDLKYKAEGRQSGLNHFWLMMQIQNRKFKLKDKAYQETLHFKELGYTESFDVSKSIDITIRACYEKKGD